MTSTTAGRLSTAFPRANQQSTTTSIIPSNFFQIPEGKYTSTLYSLIRDGRFQDVIRILSNEIQVAPRSRAALSLLAYSYYHVQDFHAASNCYEQLIRFIQMYTTTDCFTPNRFSSLLITWLLKKSVKALMRHNLLESF
ncbi:hypothetical protein BASA60_007079 [Batrachochytrium salamandrivorans]|nr:hypothetical protein BASA60_007079 [Batrachochytrium salamandrivorans]